MKNEYFGMSQQIASRGYFWVQGAGGNVSVKEGSELHVKPSGQRLDAVSESPSYSRIHLPSFLKGLEALKSQPSEQAYADLIQASNLESPRASMETGFHAALEYKFVAHFHSLVSLLVSHEYKINPERVIEWLKLQKFEKTFGFYQFLPLALPGLQLSLQVVAQKAQVYFLENHGIILASDDPLPFSELWKLEEQFCKDFGYNQSLSLRQGNQKLSKAPLRFFFPDFCIVFPKLAPFLLAEEKNEMELNANCSDLNLQEIWWSHCFLQASQPMLGVLPDSYIETVSKLPTELLRKKILQIRES